jgi:hypothetical protein
MTAPGSLIYGDDIHRQYYFFREFFRLWLSRGIWPWWNPYLFGGEPFIANPVVNIWYPPTWLFVVLPLPISYPVHLMLHIFWAMAGMYLLLNKVTPSRLAAWTGGIVFGLSGFFMARTYAGHVDVIAAASWLPWVVLGFLLFLEKPGARRLAMASGAFAFQLFAGYQTMAFFTVIAVGFVAIVESLKHRSVRPLLLAVGAGFIGVLLAAIQIIPEQEFFRQSIRTFSLPYSWISYGSLTMQSLLQFINPFYFGDQTTYHGPPPNFIEHSAYVGVGGILLALVGVLLLLLTSKKRQSATPVVLGFAACLVYGIWMSLGSNAGADLQFIAWKIIPMYRFLRIPPRHLILVVFGLSGLAAFGLGRVRGTVLRTVASIAVCVELVLFAGHFIAVKPLPVTRHDASLISTLTSDAEPVRTLENFGVWIAPRDSLDFDSVMPYGIFSATGYDPSILRSYYSYIASSMGLSGDRAVLSADVQIPFMGAKDADVLDRLNIKYILVPPAYDPFGSSNRYRLLKEDVGRDYRLYENTTVIPRYFFPAQPGSSVHVVSYTPNEVELDVTAIHDGILESSEVYYPGWAAYVDGKKTDLTVSNGVFRTLSVPSGKHRIRMVYKPIIFVYGGFVSLVTCLGLIVAVKKRK